MNLQGCTTNKGFFRLSCIHSTNTCGTLSTHSVSGPSLGPGDTRVMRSNGYEWTCACQMVSESEGFPGRGDAEYIGLVGSSRANKKVQVEGRGAQGRVESVHHLHCFCSAHAPTLQMCSALVAWCRFGLGRTPLHELHCYDG